MSGMATKKDSLRWWPSSYTSTCTIQFLKAGILGILAGMTWDGPLYLIGFLFFVPVLWFMLRPYESMIFIFSYYLFSLKSLPILFARYNNPYSHEYLSKFILLWILYAGLLSFPWFTMKGILYKIKQPGIMTMAPIIPIILGIIPPFYIIGVASPVEAAGIFFPGMGLVGIFLYFIAIISLCLVINKKVKANHSLLLTFFIFYSVYCNREFKKPEPPKNWVAVSTQFAPQINKSETHARYIFLVTSLKSLVDDGYHVIVLPENAIGLWSKKTKSMWSQIGNYARSKGATVLSGAFLNVGKDNKSFDGGIVAFGKQNGIVYLTRQPVPMTEWISFFSKGERVHWFSKGTNFVNRIKIAFIVCYEELLPGILISSFLPFDKPKLIISVANNWMGKGTGEWHAQLDSLSVMARLFGTPFLRSWNK